MHFILQYSSLKGIYAVFSCSVTVYCRRVLKLYMENMLFSSSQLTAGEHKHNSELNYFNSFT